MSAKDTAARIIVDRLVTAGMSPWSSHQFGIVDRDKVVQIIKACLDPFEVKLPLEQWRKDKREGKKDAFVK